MQPIKVANDKSDVCAHANKKEHFLLSGMKNFHSANNAKEVSSVFWNY
jgi:hypothetical protein